MFKKDNSYLLDYTRQIDRRVNDLNDLSTISKKELDIIIVTISAINQERKDNESKINTIIDLIQNIKSNFEISVKKKITEIEQKISNNDTEILNKKIKEMEQKKDYKNNLEKIHMIEIPNNLNDVKFPKIILNKGTYFIDLTLTFINNNIVNDASVIIDLIAKTDNKNILIGRSSHTWYGRFNGDDIYHGYQTVIINGILDIDNATNVDFYTKSIDQRHCSIVAYVKEYPALLRIY